MRYFRLISLFVVVFSAFVYKCVKVDLIEQCELEKCTFCYGTDLCELFLSFKINIFEDSLSEFIANRFGVKNVFYAELFGKKIVLKKLAHSNELKCIDESICLDNNLTKNCDLNSIKTNQNYTLQILNNLMSDKQDVIIKNFKVCSKATAFVFIENFTSSLNEDNLKHIWTTLKINAEPLLLQLLNDSKWPVPKYLGACGRLTAQSYCGTALNTFENADWLNRAYLAYQLLIAAKNFTFDHNKFAFYLTDVSPDNIAVDANFKLTFIDLENVILKLHTEGNNLHYSTTFEENTSLFAYSENDICNSHFSDHNFYAICKLLLSSDAPWPMMHGGLLHSAPSGTVTKQLFDNIDLCVNPKGSVTRFTIAERILDMLEDILYEAEFNTFL